MRVNGRECSLVIKTSYQEMGIPYAEETIREAAELLAEEASLEGDGFCRAIRKSGGVTGCVVSPLTLGTAPLLLCLAMGSAGAPVYVSETRSLYLYTLDLLPAEESVRFAVGQDRGGSRMLYEDCVVTGFELRIAREQAVKLKLDIRGKRAPAIWPWQDMASAEAGERFMGDRVSYRVNGGEYANIYGFTMTARKEDGTRTEVWIHRALEPGADFPAVIDTMSVTALLLRDKYELRHYGMFRLTLSRLLLMADETAVDCGDSVIGPLRYYVAGKVKAEVFTNSGETLE